MQINLNEKISEHFKRVEDLAEEAAEDSEEKFGSRAAAMSTVTTMLKELTKAQSEVINMERLMRIEATVIETIKEFLPPAQHQRFLDQLEQRLEHIS